MKNDLIKRIRKLNVLIVATLVVASLCMDSAQAQTVLQPTGFEFYFNGPNRGMRVWRRDGQTWTETYPSGQRGVFRIKTFPYRFHGMTGTLVQKVDERDFYVFIPNLGSAKMEVWADKAPKPWAFLAKMKKITPVRID